MNVDELTGWGLNEAVAKCLGILYTRHHGEVVDRFGNPLMYNDDWSLAGEIIEREKIGIWWATHFVDGEGNEYGNHWYAEIGCTDANADSPYCGVATGPTPLIAAMRCYVASKQGEK